ncbi:MAG: hypothetical protein ACHQ01_04400 [Candidatus Limnocylindrales bacterium]
MFRLPKPALAVFAGLVVVFASACSSNSATFPAGATGPAGASSNPTTAASVAATLNASDPNSIITQAINGGAAVKSFHIKIALDGTIKAAALASADSSLGAAITSDVTLTGTAIEGDVDVAAQAAHLTLTVPAMQMLGNVPITGDLILKDNVLYYKVSLLGPKYTKTDLSSLTSGLPVAVPTPGASALTSLTGELAQLQSQMAAAGVTATLVGVEQIGGQDAYHINVSVPLDKINAAIAASSPSTAMTIDSASIDFWVYKANYQIAKVEFKGASAALGNVDFTVTVTAYDQPVTITAPAAADITP